MPSIDLLKEAVDDNYTPMEYRACVIAGVYESLRRGFFPKEPYTALNRNKDKRESKNFAYFYKLATMEQENRSLIPDITLFLRAQFEMTNLKSGPIENWTPIAPHCLVSSMAWERYRTYIEHLYPRNSVAPERDSEKKVIRSLGKTALLLARTYQDLFNQEDINWRELFNYTKDGDYIPMIFLLIQNNMISKYFLCASRGYPLWLKGLDPDVRMELPQDLPAYRQSLRVLPKAQVFGRRAFGEEFQI